jgi:hypothetical protein
LPHGRAPGRRRLGRLATCIESPAEDRGEGDGENGTDGCGHAEPSPPDAPHRRELERRLFGRSEARVVLVDEEISVESEVVRVRAEKSTGVGGAGNQVEALVLERLEIPRADVRIRVDLGELEAAANSRRAEAIADLEHPAPFTPFRRAHRRLCLHFVEIRDSRLVVERYSLPPTSAKDFQRDPCL